VAEYASVERRGEVAVLRLERPPANAIDLELCESVERQFDALMLQKPGAIVFTGGTGPFFSGGLNLKVIPSYTADQQRMMVRAINRIVAKLYPCPVPVIGAINGHAIAGGFILALISDYRVGPIGGAMLGLTEARVGIPFPAAPMIVLQAELSPEHVRCITFQARNFGPEEALKRGVLDELRPPEFVLERAVEVAADMATIPSEAYARIKHQIRADAIERLEHLVASDDDPMLDGWLTGDTTEAAASVLSGTSTSGDAG
jgi:enoyl-CoA hydratase